MTQAAKGAAPAAPVSVLVFLVDGERHAVPADRVEEIARAVAVTALPGAPPVIAGVVDRRGTVVPVLDLRRRFDRAPRGAPLADQLVFVRAGTRHLALRVDEALELTTLPPGDLVGAQSVTSRAGTLAGVARLPGGLVLVHDLAAFLEQAEAEALDRALAAREPR